MSILNHNKEQQFNSLVNEMLSDGVSEDMLIYSVAYLSSRFKAKQKFDRSKCGRGNHKSYDFKVLSDRYLGAYVHIEGHPESRAQIIRGYNNKCTDMFNVISTGAHLNCDEYLRKYYSAGPDTEFGYRNTYKILFDVNPRISVGKLKKTKLWYSLLTIDDIINYGK